MAITCAGVQRYRTQCKCANSIPEKFDGGAELETCLGARTVAGLGVPVGVAALQAHQAMC